MAKVFRLFQDKNLQHWEDRGEAYGPSVIEKIPNPDGDFSKREPTSIPSPFARIDLVRTAYKYVVDKNELEGNTIYHKLISDCLDVGEMFFKIDSLGSRAQIKFWDKNIDLNTLKNSSNPRHKLYGETLDLFLKQDKETYNFDSLNRMFFLFYDFQIIGGTSPSTLFFTCANDLNFTKIQFGNDILFDGDLKPLYKRDPEYQKYLHHFFKANPDLVKKMSEFASYLEKNLKVLFNTNNDLHNEIKELENKTADILKQELDSIYETLDTGEAGENLEIIGCLLKKKKIKDRGKVIEENSDFVIKSSKYAGGHKPLVLQNNFTQKLNYTDKSVHWNSSTAVPYFDKETDINNRTLPGQLDRYPYLTVSDFLQAQIIRLVYPINKDRFWNGNIRFETGDKNKHFLLPLTKKFFDFFDTADLQKQMPDGKPMFEMVVYSGSVEVILRIPIKSNSQYITFKRTYDNKGIANAADPDVINNRGFIVENQFSLAVYPFVKTGSDTGSFYRVMLLDRDINTDTKHYRYDLAFNKNANNETISQTDKKTRSNKLEDRATTVFYILEKEFDYIEVKHNDATGVVIPLFKEVGGGSDSFTFAIDFGTTNTHIEYKIGNGNPKPFEITKDDLQFATLFAPEVRNDISSFSDANFMYEIIPHEFLPEVISKQTEFRFPQRTALSEYNKLNLNEATYSLADFNIPFTYEKYAKKPNANVSTNLKWSNYTMNDEDRIRIERFFEKLIFLIRTKVLLNNGRLDSTKLIWFYPSSMMTVRRNNLERTWQKLFAKYISTQSSPIKLSESIAPFYYFKNKGGIDASDLPVAAIDIGGGTSDIVIYQKNKPESLTSFRFAANSIFGDAFNGSPAINGFVKKYLPLYEKLLSDNNLYDLQAVMKEISEEQSSEDIVAFYFSLENNKLIQDKNLQSNLSFNEKLANDDDLKIVFVVFYSSIIYHLAKLMNAKGLKAPRYLTFSGTGSKVISITDRDKDLNALQKLTKLIFEKVFGEAVGNIELIQHPEPKEITCKGGLLSETNIDIEEIKTVLIGDKENTLIPETNLNYTEVNNEAKLKSIVDEVKTFIDIVFGLHTEFNLTKNFGVNPAKIEDYKTILKEDLMQYLKSGLENKTHELSGNTNINIEEPLFFYPLVGALNKLAFKIVTQNNN
jgi:hypothetical protein